MTISIDLDEKQIKEEGRKRPLIKKQPVKEVKIKKTRKINWKKTLIISLLVLLVGSLSFAGYKIYKMSRDVGFKIKPKDLIAQEDPELKKDSSGKFTNILLVGIDSRSETSSLINTDTIIMASFNHESKDITLMSVPRDFYVSIPAEFWFNKINSFYGYGEGLLEGGGLPMLQTKVEELLGEEIQYYAMIDLKGFVRLIDSFGGVYVNVENSFTDFMYPADTGSGYQTVKFVAGPQTMDGDTALKYSRSRQSMDNGEGSDFARARRQQKVIDAIKKELLDSGNYTNPQIILDLINNVGDNITASEFSLDDIKAGLNIAQGLKDGEGEVHSFVLDPNAGNGKLVTSKNVTTTKAYAIGPVAGLGEYDDIHDYVDRVLANPSFYEEDSLIYVYNTGLGYQESYQTFQELQERYPYSKITFRGTLYSDKVGTVIYEHETGLKPSTLKEISTYLKTENTTQPEYILNNLNGEDISILLGKIVSVEQEENTENE